MHLVSGLPWETITLTTLSRDRDLLSSLLSEARDLAMKGQEGKLVVHTAWGADWKPFGLPRRKRPLKSVVLEDGVAERIEGDVKTFLNRREWYTDRGKATQTSSPVSRLTGPNRYTVSQGISPARSSRVWEIIVYSGTRWFAFIRYLHSELIRTRPN